MSLLFYCQVLFCSAPFNVLKEHLPRADPRIQYPLEKLIGPKRIKTTYAFKSLLDVNTKLVFGSDWPVAPASPILGMYAAVTRKTLDGLNPYGWVPEQKISIEQSLYAYTKDAAYSSYDEDNLGSLDIGKLADFVILSDDLTKINSDKIKDVKVLSTYVGGKQVYKITN